MAVIEHIKRRLGRNVSTAQELVAAAKHELWPVIDALLDKLNETISSYNAGGAWELENLGSGVTLASKSGQTLVMPTLVAGEGVTLTPDEEAGTVTVAGSGSGSGTRVIAVSWCNNASTSLRYLPWGDVNEASSRGHEHMLFFPSSGRLTSVLVNVESDAGSTDISFEVAASVVAEVTETCPNNTVVLFDFSDEATTFAAMDVLAIRIDPSTAPNDIKVIAVFDLDE